MVTSLCLLLYFVIIFHCIESTEQFILCNKKLLRILRQQFTAPQVLIPFFESTEVTHFHSVYMLERGLVIRPF